MCLCVIGVYVCNVITQRERYRMVLLHFRLRKERHVLYTVFIWLGLH